MPPRAARFPESGRRTGRACSSSGPAWWRRCAGGSRRAATRGTSRSTPRLAPRLASDADQAERYLGETKSARIVMPTLEVRDGLVLRRGGPHHRGAAPRRGPYAGRPRRSGCRGSASRSPATSWPGPSPSSAIRPRRSSTRRRSGAFSRCRRRCSFPATARSLRDDSTCGSWRGSPRRSATRSARTVARGRGWRRRAGSWTWKNSAVPSRASRSFAARSSRCTWRSPPSRARGGSARRWLSAD